MSYAQNVFETVRKRNAGEQEFLQAVKEVLDSLDPVFDGNPQYEEAAILERITEPDCEPGFLFDGFPRTLAQAEAMLEAGVAIDAVVEIAVPDDDIVARLSGRRSHPGSGRVYHVTFNPPKVEGIDDETGEPLVHRDDDQEDTIRNRLATYHAQTEVLTSFYGELDAKGEAGAAKLIKVDGTQSIDGVRDEALAELGKIAQ